VAVDAEAAVDMGARGSRHNGNDGGQHGDIRGFLGDTRVRHQARPVSIEDDTDRLPDIGVPNQLFERVYIGNRFPIIGQELVARGDPHRFGGRPWNDLVCDERCAGGILADLDANPSVALLQGRRDEQDHHDDDGDRGKRDVGHREPARGALLVEFLELAPYVFQNL